MAGMYSEDPTANPVETTPNYTKCTGLNSISKLDTSFLRAEPNIYGLIGVIAFYILILIIGIVASWWGRRKNRHIDQSQSDDVMLAGRNIGLFVGIFTMTATWVGGGYINGTAEVLFNPDSGLMWAQAPVGYALSLVIGGIMFARKMREKEYTTMLDPFEERYGSVVTAFLYIPALLGDIFWTAAILSALGASLSVVVGLNHIWAVLISAFIAILYTFIGGLYSVAYTDVIQLICIFVGLVLVIPFAWLHPAVTSIVETANSDTQSWLGTPPTDEWWGLWVDSALLLLFGGIPWQVYFQRVLSQKTPTSAMALSFVAGAGCIIMAAPAVLIGAIAASTDWNQTDYVDFGEIPVPACDYGLGLPMVMQFLTPTPVAVIGLGAVSAAVMSSADSSVLSSSSMFAKNLYKPLRDACCSSKPASEKEIIWVMRVAVIFVGAAAAVMAILVNSVYALWFLCSDLIYAILFPQLVCVIYINFTNSAGSMAGFVVGVVLRLLGGEPTLGIPAVIEYPWFYVDEDTGGETQLFPFRTLTMIISFIVILLVSAITRPCFKKCCPNHGTPRSRQYNKQATGASNPGFDNDQWEFTGYGRQDQKTSRF